MEASSSRSGPSRLPRGTPTFAGGAAGSYSSKLDLVSSLSYESIIEADKKTPYEKLKAMIAKNTEEKLALHEQKEALADAVGDEEDAWMAEDPEIVDGKM